MSSDCLEVEQKDSKCYSDSPRAQFSSLSWPARIKAVFWGNPPEDMAERKLLLKIDLLVMSFVCLNYWINYVDRSNIANAYISGMKEDLNMTGDDFNVINTVFYVGYIVSMVPNNIMLLKVPPRYWLSFCCFAWAMLTLGFYKVTSYKQMCVIRFFQACFESSTFAGTHLILGSWYKEHEINTRSATFTSSGLIGIIFSGFMQGAIYTSMDGKRGLAGWRWLFIIIFSNNSPNLFLWPFMLSWQSRQYESFIFLFRRRADYG